MFIGDAIEMCSHDFEAAGMEFTSHMACRLYLAQGQLPLISPIPENASK